MPHRLCGMSSVMTRQYRETYLQNLNPQCGLFELMGLNFLKKNDSDHEKHFGATNWSQFEYEKQPFGL
jgi:hypothetical protein